MTEEQILNLPVGIYKVFWKTGGSSIASMGSGLDGRKGLAPTNWVFPTNAKGWWERVERMEQFPVVEQENG